MTQKTCLIAGVGAGTGQALVRRFVAGGYRVVMLARRTRVLEELVDELGEAVWAYPCDMADRPQLEAMLEETIAAWGVPEVAVHNGARGSFGTFQEVSAEDLEENFRINTVSLLHLGQALAPAMLERGSGSLIVTGNTSAWRGVPNFSAFAPTKAAQRILAQSMARTLGPQGIHVAYVVIDAVIDIYWTRKRWAGRPDDFFIKPAAIADEVFHVAHQDRSAWSFEVEIRPFGETW